MECFHGCAVRLFPNDPRTPFHSALVDHEMCTRGRYPYGPNFADRPIELPIPWQKWITGAAGLDGEGSGDTARDGDGGMEDNKVGEGEDAGNTKAGSLPSTVLPTHSSQT